MKSIDIRIPYHYRKQKVIFLVLTIIFAMFIISQMLPHDIFPFLQPDKSFVDELPFIPTALADNYKVITIDNPIAGYQMKLNVTYEASMQADFDDLRFYDGATPLDYWLEYKVDSNYAIVWVKLNDSGNTITMEYGDAGLSSASTTDTWDYWLDWTSDHTGDFTLYKSDSNRYVTYSISMGVSFNSTTGYRTLESSGVYDYYQSKSYGMYMGTGLINTVGTYYQQKSMFYQISFSNTCPLGKQTGVYFYDTSTTKGGVNDGVA